MKQGITETFSNSLNGVFTINSLNQHQNLYFLRDACQQQQSCSGLQALALELHHHYQLSFIVGTLKYILIRQTSNIYSKSISFICSYQIKACQLYRICYFVYCEVSHTTPLLRSLHGLPVAARIRFKTLALAYRAANGSGPVYIGIWSSRKPRKVHSARQQPIDL